MPRPKKGKRLGGSPEHQRKILSNLTADLIEYEYVMTTHAKAKVLRPYAEKVITKARRGDLHARRRRESRRHDESGGMPCRSGGQLVSLQDDDVTPPSLGQVVCDAAADDSTPNDDHARVAGNGRARFFRRGFRH